MSKNNKEFSFSDNKMKSKLDAMWNELQSNLPVINFDDHKDEDKNSDADDYDIITSKDTFRYDEQDFDFDDDLKDLNLNKIKEIENEADLGFKNRMQSFESDNASLNDIHINNFDNSTNINMKLKSLTKMNKTNSSISMESAEKITKNIFESTNSKLSMEIFNSINIDDLLNTVGTKGSNNQISLYGNKTNQNYNPSDSHNDENILKKLAEMSMQISNDTNLSNLDFKTGAVSKHNSANRSNYNEAKINNSSEQQSPKKRSAFELMEAELFPLSKNENIDDLITKDLNSYLKSHNIKDGNLVETRRIDLRSSQNMIGVSKKVYSKTIADTLFESILNYDECNDWDKVKEDKKNNRLKFLNEASDESESSDSDSDTNENVDRALWIERYRKQKLANSK